MQELRDEVQRAVAVEVLGRDADTLHVGVGLRLEPAVARAQDDLERLDVEPGEIDVHDDTGLVVRARRRRRCREGQNASDEMTASHHQRAVGPGMTSSFGGRVSA